MWCLFLGCVMYQHQCIRRLPIAGSIFYALIGAWERRRLGGFWIDAYCTRRYLSSRPAGRRRSQEGDATGYLRFCVFAVRPGSAAVSAAFGLMEICTKRYRSSRPAGRRRSQGGMQGIAFGCELSARPGNAAVSAAFELMHICTKRYRSSRPAGRRRSQEGDATGNMRLSVGRHLLGTPPSRRLLD